MSVIKLLGVRDQPLSVDEVLAAVADPAAGGTVVFIGTVRDEDSGKTVDGLGYTAHPSVEDALRSVGAATIVCLSERPELADRYPSYVEWLDANQPARAVWHPVPDLHAPDLAAATDLLAELRRRIDAGEGLLVHCGAGIGRAGTTAVALLLTMGVPLGDAKAVVAAHRPMAGPEVGAQAELLAALAAQVP